jgi:ElaB/YqjD/DUF883 family membrane-anchored ribosome-binding protein
MERYGSLDPKVGEKAQGIAENVQSTVKDAIKNVSAEVQGRVEAARETIKELREKDVSEILDEARNFVGEHPLATMGACLFLGYSMGKLFGRRS